MTKDYKNKCVIVTGAGVGIGYAICKAFAKSGTTVALNDIDPALAQQAASRINSDINAERVFPYACDVADVPAMRKLVDDFSGRHNRLDVVIANAGITSYGSFLDYTVEEFDRLAAVNLRGSYFTAQAAARKMIELNTKNGRILLVSSVTGVQALPSLGAYGITKAGIRHMAKVLAIELGSFGITVNAIAPGATLTERTIAEDPNYESRWSQITPAGRVGYVEDIATAAIFLASPEARHVTGQTLVVDGGWTFQSPMPDES